MRPSLAEFLGQQLSLFHLPPAAPVPAPRHLVLDGKALPYSLHRGGRRRRLTLTIDERGLRIGAPQNVSLRDIEAFAQEHRHWIVQKLTLLTSATPPHHISVVEGSRLPLLDGDMDVRVLPGANRSRWIGSTLLLEARSTANLNLLTRRALQKRALAHFSSRVDYYCPLLSVDVPALALSSARTRWGSCSRQGGIRINWRLIHLPARLGDYVVVHELAHLHEMNHGPRFWAWVEQVCPDWRQARSELRQTGTRIPLL